MKESPGLVLDKIPYGDRDLIVTILTRDYGVVSAMARGARGSKRRFAGGLDLFVEIAVGFKSGRSALATLVSTEVLGQFPGI